MQIITEGKAKFYASIADDKKISKSLDVFYNPVMKFNRDISVLLLKSVADENMQMIDLMAGSGVRSIRFLQELPPSKISSIIINDLSKGFFALMKKDFALNAIQEDSERIMLRERDANQLLLESFGFDYIEVDPFGSPNPFLENSIIRLSRRGILAVTATDTAPLCGTYPKTCMRNYWGIPIRNHLMHEVGLRILIRKIQLTGMQHDKALIPIYSYYRNHYFRIFFRCKKSKELCDKLIANHQYIHYCSSCMQHTVSFENTGHCCNTPVIIAGPLWSGELFDHTLAVNIQHSVSQDSDIPVLDKNFIDCIATESAQNIVGFYDIHKVAEKFKYDILDYETLLDKLRKKHVAIRTHFSPHSIKTTASINELKDLLKKTEKK